MEACRRSFRQPTPQSHRRLWRLTSLSLAAGIPPKGWGRAPEADLLSTSSLLPCLALRLLPPLLWPFLPLRPSLMAAFRLGPLPLWLPPRKVSPQGL
jgi:hypothetical protein